MRNKLLLCRADDFITASLSLEVYERACAIQKRRVLSYLSSLLDSALPPDFRICFVQASRLPDDLTQNENENAKFDILL